MIKLSELEAARVRIAGAIFETPLIENAALNARTRARVLVKAECLQRYGAFKIRGAFNRLAAFSPQERANGVLAYSSGNHGLAATAAAMDFRLPAVIVMPSDAPAIKVDTIRSLGGEIIAYDRVREDREAIGARIAQERGLALIKPFDDPYVIAGQGTIGLEIAERLQPDLVLTPASGGGLVGGIASALKHKAPNAGVIAVEPEGHDDLARSLAAGERRANAPGVRSICDALLVDQPGAIPFAIAQETRIGVRAVTDEEVLAAMAFAFAHLKLVIEPSGAAGLAALLAGKVDAADQSVVVIASGGNVDRAMFARALERSAWI